VADLLSWLIGPCFVTRRRETPGPRHSDWKQNILSVAASLLLLLPPAALGALNGDLDQPQSQQSGESSAIIDKYLQATQAHEDSLRGGSMEVDIVVDVPKLKEHGTLLALRKISKVGQITYHVLRFQGDNTVKNQVIGRYLQAEQQGQGDQSLAITPANYKFKYRGEKQETNGNVYVFQLSPRKKKVGLFKGEMWLDASTCLPVYERGRLVKNPSIFFKKVDFMRFWVIQNGLPVPEYMTSTIDVRLIGKVELSINYSKFAPNTDTAETADTVNSDAVSNSAANPSLPAQPPVCP
jgi:hypothetical protein